MTNQLKIGKKIGYFRPHTCKYEWSVIVEMNEHSVQLESKIQGRTYRFWEITEDIISFSKMLSSDYPNRTLIKI